MALVHCKLKRAGGTYVHFGEGEDARRYHFAPNDKDHHVAEVAHEDDLARLLAIPEAYELYGSKPAKPLKPVIEETDSGADAENANVTGDTEVSAYASYNRDELAAMVEARTGKKPHHKAGVDKLIAELTALDNTEKSDAEKSG